MFCTIKFVYYKSFCVRDDIGSYIRTVYHMVSHTPKGWQTEWVRCDCQEIHFNLHRCLYWDVTKQFGCPELCCVFCESDDISFSGLASKINFLRNGTLGSGADCCDFHFIKAQ